MAKCWAFARSVTSLRRGWTTCWLSLIPAHRRRGHHQGSLPLSLALQPFPKPQQPGQGFLIPLAISCLFALNDVINASNGKAISIDVPLPCILKAFDTIGSEDQV